MNKISLQALHARFPLFPQLFRFGVVGLSAAIIHFSTVIILVQTYHFAPLVANILGFLTAFQFCYWGHRKWTFSDTQTMHRIAFSKLLIVQLINFAMNELLFFIFLSLNLPYPIALIIVLAVLPIFTFAASKLWVFKD